MHTCLQHVGAHSIVISWQTDVLANLEGPNVGTTCGGGGGQCLCASKGQGVSDGCPTAAAVGMQTSGDANKTRKVFLTKGDIQLRGEHRQRVSRLNLVLRAEPILFKEQEQKKLSQDGMQEEWRQAVGRQLAAPVSSPLAEPGLLLVMSLAATAFRPSSRPRRSSGVERVRTFILSAGHCLHSRHWFSDRGGDRGGFSWAGCGAAHRHLFIQIAGRRSTRYHLEASDVGDGALL